MQQNYGQPGAVGAGEPRLSTGRYEFPPYEASRISQMAGRTKVWGVVALAGGTLSLLIALLFGILVLVAAKGAIMFIMLGTAMAMFFGSLANAATGYFFIQAGKELDMVEATQGDDVEALMQGLTKLSHAFKLEVFVGGGAALVGILLAIVIKFLA